MKQVNNILFLQDFRGTLDCHTRERAMGGWPSNELDETEHWVQVAIRSRLTNLDQLMFRRINDNLISAFVERWHPETNTFHMPFGEMTITLHDVLAIIGKKIFFTNFTLRSLIIIIIHIFCYDYRVVY